MIPTPICDFVRAYAEGRPARLHMPGHKGRGPLGFESLDITEIDGADDLFAPSGIISESEAVASRLFGARTFYSAEGSSLAIRAMLFAALGGARRGERPLVLAGRNAHRAFLSAAALLDLDVEWLYPRAGQTLHGCAVSPADVDAALARLSGRCLAVYLTSPDYLGGLADIAGIAAACRRHGARLLVDGAHGAYLKFLPGSLHPIDLGADMCCDSAHKTLPALTGAAYLHVSPASGIEGSLVRRALALFGSSSPSWLILQSLDACNRLLADFPAQLAAFLPKLQALREALAAHGYALTGDEPMKLTILARPFGTTGDALAASLAREGVTCEFHDPDYLTLMPSPMNTDDDLRRLQKALLRIPPAPATRLGRTMSSALETGAASGAPARRLSEYPAAGAPEDSSRPPERVLSIREATFAPGETLPLDQCEGRVLAAPALSCPPCVPIAICGERLDAKAIARLRYYGVQSCEVCRAAQPSPDVRRPTPPVTSVPPCLSLRERCPKGAERARRHLFASQPLHTANPTQQGGTPMNENIFKRNELLAQTVIKGLGSRNMTGYYAKDRAEALRLALDLIPEGSSVTMGGAMSAREIGLVDALKAGNYNFIDRDNYADRREAMLLAYDADVFLTSANALTEDGMMVNIDGNSNRVSAIAQGPRKVLVIAGMNKVCKDLDGAMKRARNVAAPINAQRFGLSTPCAKTGACMDCKSPDTICCQFLITRYSKHKDRIHVILVNDSLGF